MSPRIRMIQGSSTDPKIAAEVAKIASGYRNVMVFLDSNHTHDHVLAELNAYAPLVSPNSYCVVFDTIIERMPASLHSMRSWGPGNNPMTAVDAFLSGLSARPHKGLDGQALHFDIDRTVDDKLLISVAPRGYLRRAPTS